MPPDISTNSSPAHAPRLRTHDVTATIPASLDQLSPARRHLQAWLAGLDLVPTEQCEAAALVFVELLTNGIDAAGAGSEIHYSFHAAPDELVLQVINGNPSGGAVQLRSMPDALATSGRGLALAQEFADRLDIHSAGAFVHVDAVFSRHDHGGPNPTIALP